MIVKIFKQKKGVTQKNANACFNYLLNERVEQGTAKVLRGSPEITKSIISSLTTKRKYDAGCLSFTEKNLTHQQKEEIMNLFEQTLFPGIHGNICWVEHTDKQNISELNFVVPRTELLTGKSFNPYFHKIDVKRFSAFRDYINAKYNLSNPLDPKREQSLKLGDLVKYKKNEHIKHLDTYIQSLIKKGFLHNQNDVVEELKKLGYTITRVGKEYISIKTDSMKAIRLKGRHYSKFCSPKKIEKYSLKQLYLNLQKEIKKAAQFNIDKYYGGLNMEAKEEKKKPKVSNSKLITL